MICKPISGDACSLDYEWQPPSEAEMKLIRARRDRSDKISKLMGDYLLKGYKMLSTVCECGVCLVTNPWIFLHSFFFKSIHVSFHRGSSYMHLMHIYMVRRSAF